MAANVETAAYANIAAWHREGAVLDTKGAKGMTIEQALDASGLNWEVEKVPIYADFNGEPVEVEGRWGVQRKTDGKVFGTVGKSWTPVQNTEGFKIVDDFIALAQGEGHKTWVESAMALDGGKKVVIMVHIDTDMQIAGEKYNSYLTFFNGHDGRTSVTAMVNDVRVVCQNTLSMAVDETGQSGRIVRVRHTAKAGDRLTEAAHILGLRNRRAEQLAVQGEWLVERELSEGQFMDFMYALLPKSENPSAETMASTRRAEIAGVYFDAKNLDPIRGTRWGALQAVVEHADHGREFKSFDIEARNVLGMTPQPLKQDAFDILANPAKRIKAIA